MAQGALTVESRRSKRARQGSKTSKWLRIGGGIGIVVAVGVTLSSSIQVTLVVLGLMVAVILRSRSGVVAFAALLVPTTGLIRRLVAGPTAHEQSDPLLLLPILMILAIVLISLTRPRVDRARSFMRFVVVTAIVGIAGAVVLTASFTTDALFSATLMVTPMMLAIVLSSGRLPPVWDAVLRILPVTALLAAAYGIYQFFVLPQWDKAWMLSSQLTSIGHPYPLQVRVFGASESPGPYASFIGLVLVICLYITVVKRKGVAKLRWMLLCLFLVVPLLLSGVRSALIGVAISAIVLALFRARGATRVLIVLFFIGVYYLLTTVISRFGAGSTILNAGRYTQFSTTDTSLQSRLALLAYLRDPFAHVIGSPSAAETDNLFIDALVRYGLLPATALFVLMLCLVFVSLRNLVRHQNETAALAVVFIATQTVFGNVYGSLFGILVGIAIGTVMTRTVAGPSLAMLQMGMPGLPAAATPVHWPGRALWPCTRQLS